MPSSACITRNFVTQQSCSSWGTTGDCEAQRVIPLFMLYPSPQHADKPRSHPRMIILSLKYLLVSLPKWSSRNDWCHDRVWHLIEPCQVALRISPLKRSWHPMILLWYQVNLKIIQYHTKIYAVGSRRSWL